MAELGSFREILRKQMVWLTGLIERIGHGKFRVTDQGSKYEYEELQCESCGKNFYSRVQAENSSGMKCEHNSISKSVFSYSKDERQKTL